LGCWQYQLVGAILVAGWHLLVPLLERVPSVSFAV
jgi:hypothetical protein